jgi:hypothetical protein
VIDHEGRHINLLYDLATGMIGPCTYDPGYELGYLEKPWSEFMGAVFSDPQCAGQPYEGHYDAIEPELLPTRRIYFAESDYWYIDGSACVEMDHWYLEVDLTCVGPYKDDVCPLKPIPGWVQNLLPNPPYTLDVEYE